MFVDVWVCLRMWVYPPLMGYDTGCVCTGYIAPAISYANNIQLLYPRYLNEEPDVLYVFYMLKISHEYSMTTSF